MPKRYPIVPVDEFEALVHIVRKLRKECPWDREQTHQSIRHSLIEETYEVVEALDNNDLDELKNELGDLLLHIVLHATMGEQEGEFTLKDVITGINDKLIRRHPHIFGTAKVGSATEVKHNWEKIKMDEGRESVLDGVPINLPALQRALRLQEKAAKVGFDWKAGDDVWKKVTEESDEFREALKSRSMSKREDEFGDLLFALVNYARFTDINPENALRRTIDKFTTRFRFIEDSLKSQDRTVYDSSLEEMDELWNKAKKRRKKIT